MSSSIEFAEFNREKIVTGPFTKLEYFILENILRYCDEEDISTTRDNIHSMYTQIVKAAIQSDPNIPISHKNISDIEKFLVIYKKKYLLTLSHYARCNWNGILVGKFRNVHYQLLIKLLLLLPCT